MAGRRGHLGVFGLGAGLAETLGPGLLIALCISWGRPGWYVVGALFALTGLVTPLAVRWAQRHQPLEADQDSTTDMRTPPALSASVSP